jgi:hypothetical protein
VHDLLFDFPLHIDMTGEAEVRSLFYEQSCGVRLMRVMAGRAVTRGSGAVDKLEIVFIGMARDAEVLEGLGKELRLRRVVRVVASSAHSVFDGWMHVFHCVERGMALGAQLGNLLCELESLFVFLGMRRYNRLVTGIARLRCGVDIFGLQHALVTFCGHAALFGPVGAGKAQGKQDQHDWYYCCVFHQFYYLIQGDYIARIRPYSQA